MKTAFNLEQFRRDLVVKFHNNRKGMIETVTFKNAGEYLSSEVMVFMEEVNDQKVISQRLCYTER